MNPVTLGSLYRRFLSKIDFLTRIGFQTINAKQELVFRNYLLSNFKIVLMKKKHFLVISSTIKCMTTDGDSFQNLFIQKHESIKEGCRSILTSTVLITNLVHK